MVAAAGALEMTGGQRAELERLARSNTAGEQPISQVLAVASKGVSASQPQRSGCYARREADRTPAHSLATGPDTTADQQRRQATHPNQHPASPHPTVPLAHIPTCPLEEYGYSITYDDNDDDHDGLP